MLAETICADKDDENAFWLEGNCKLFDRTSLLQPFRLLNLASLIRSASGTRLAERAMMGKAWFQLVSGKVAMDHR